ncbi:MAG: hypothetical protein CTY16_20410 [Methylobacter sp.]|nr:MAG: hypothetical protein CTY16_20410 [Methylobacter sp.]
MSEYTKSYEENKEKNKIIHVTCLKCKIPTRQKIVVSYDYSASAYDDRSEQSVDWSSSHQVIQCQGCMTISFRQVDWCSEDVCQIQEDEWEDGIVEKLFPERSNSKLSIKEFWEIPENLQRIYIETIDSFNNGSTILTAAGLRAIVEGLCASLGIINGPITKTNTDGTSQLIRNKKLEGKIAGLHEKGFLTEKSAEILHEHRYLGNDAVHELRQPSKEELRLAIEIIEHAFESIYQIPQKGDDLKVKRIKRTDRA